MWVNSEVEGDVEIEEELPRSAESKVGGRMEVF